MTVQIGVENDRAKRLMAMGEMAASLAHEIRNPLGSMELFCTLLKQDLLTQPSLLNLADQIHKSIKSLDRIISNCLQFARDVTPQLRELPDVTAYFQEILEQIAPRFDAAQVTVGVKVEQHNSVWIDRYQMQQALLNLLLNALDAVQARKASAFATNEQPGTDVLLWAQINGGFWQFGVTDKGTGIDSAAQQKIFDPFFTTKSHGTGLGLAVVHSIVRAHGGEISVQSEEGFGTTVQVSLPCTGNHQGA